MVPKTIIDTKRKEAVHKVFDCSEAVKWIRHAKYTLSSVVVDIEGGFYSWACFKSHQVAELALKALLRGAGVESFGHDLISLWKKAVNVCRLLKDLSDCITYLNKMYIPPRYPDAWAGETPPYESYTQRDANESYKCAELVIDKVEVCIHELCKDSY